MTIIATIVATDTRTKALASAYAAAFAAPPWNEIFHPDDVAQKWAHHSEHFGSRYLVAVDASDVILGGAEFMPLDMFPERRDSFPTITHGSLFLNELFISPLAQNRGIGSTLLKQVEAAAITHRFSHISLRTHAADKKLCDFYLHRGYVPVCEVESKSAGPLRRVFIKNLGA